MDHNHILLRRLQYHILQTLYETCGSVHSGKIERREFAKRLDLTFEDLLHHLNDLIAQGLVEETSLVSGGRTFFFLAITEEGRRGVIQWDDEVQIPSDYGQGNRWAVLIGVNRYVDKDHYHPLRYCVNDVNAMRDQLILGGFNAQNIQLLTNKPTELPNRNNILKTLQEVADKTNPDDLLFFHYSGHGQAIDDESYLIARDGYYDALRHTAISVSKLKEIMQEAPARAKVIVLDACHSGAKIGSRGPQAMTKDFIKRVFEQAEGLAILASCKQGEFCLEWRDKELGVFTRYLLEALTGKADRDEKGFVTVQDAYRYVVDQVKCWAKTQKVNQTPTLQYEVVGDIILTRYNAIQTSCDESAGQKPI